MEKLIEVFSKVKFNVNACAIELAFSGVAVPSIIEGWQPFINQTFTNTVWQKIYASIASISFQETSTTSRAGVSYNQKLTFRFPHMDQQRGLRLEQLHKIAFAKVKLTTGKDLVIGRNDYYQNTKPKIEIETNQQLCVVTIETQSISPTGFVPNFNIYGLPAFVPLNF